MDFSYLANAEVAEPNATTIRPVPEGDYRAIIDDFEVTGVEISKGARAGQTVAQLRVKWDVLDEAIKASLERDKVIVVQQCWLDLDKQGQIDTGPDKNVRLGQIREALGFNDGAFALGQLKGAGPALIKVTQRAKSADEPDIIYNDVTRVAAL